MRRRWCRELVDVPGADAGLYLDRYPHGDHLCAGRLHARAGLHLHVPVAAYPGGADRRVGAQRHLPLRSRRKAHVAEEGRRTARARRTGRRLHRLLSVRRGLSDRHRHPQRRAARVHPVRPVHRCLRHRDEEDRPRAAPDRIRQRHQHCAAPGRRAADLPFRAAAHDPLLPRHRRGRRHHAVCAC